ncbi:MAG: hypothetical protein ACJAVA_002785 [Flavobacteriaceae bacterium]|jgi:hypothetical protein
MKEKVTAMISFIGGLGWGLFGLFAIFDDSNIYLDEFLTYSALMISSISIVLYVIWTKFGNKEFSDLEKIDNENQILKKQIEQKELKKKMEE